MIYISEYTSEMDNSKNQLPIFLWLILIFKFSPPVIPRALTEPGAPAIVHEMLTVYRSI